MSAGFLELFYNGLFHPVRQYRELAEESPSNTALFYGLIYVLLVSAMAPIIQAIWKQGADVSGLVLAVPVQVVLGLMFWVVMAAVVAGLAFAFKSRPRFRTFLMLTALSTLPWVLMGPLSLLKIGLGTAGSFIGIVAGLIIWLWSVFLFAMALGVTYRLGVERVLLLLAMPFIFSTVAIFWIGGFISNISQLVP